MSEKRKVVPVNDRVLVRVDEPADKIGRILLPDNAKEKPCKGELLLCGAECPEETKNLVGHVVHFHNYSGCEAPGDKTLIYLRYTDLLGAEL